MLSNFASFYYEADWLGNFTKYDYLNSGVWGLDYSNSGKYFAAATGDGHILIYNATSKNYSLLQNIYRGFNQYLLFGLKFTTDFQHLLYADYNKGYIFYFYGN